MKSFSVLFFCIVSFQLFGQITEEGLIGYWSFNGDYEDHSGFLNHGIPDGTVLVKDRFGIEASAVEFDGIDDFIRVPHHASYSLDANNDNFTISFWYSTADPLNTAPNARFISKWNENSQFPYSHNIQVFDDYMRASIYEPPSTFQPHAPLDLRTEWVNVMIINDILADSSRIYEDGILQGSVANETTMSTSNNFDMIFGSNFGNARNYWGKMDEIRFYNRVLSQEEINQIIEETYVSTERGVLNENIRIYPNPVCSELVILSDLVINSVEILKFNGEIIKRATNSKVDFSGLSVGLYFVKVRTDQGLRVVRVIKN